MHKGASIYDIRTEGGWGVCPKEDVVQGGAGGLSVGWVDLDLECSTILLGQ